MKQTRVIELLTREDVRAFCKAMLKAKELAPVSVTFTVALTIDRAVPTRQTTNGKMPDNPIDRLFAEIDPEPLPSAILSRDTLQAAVDAVPSRVTSPVPRRQQPKPVDSGERRRLRRRGGIVPR